MSQEYKGCPFAWKGFSMNLCRGRGLSSSCKDFLSSLLAHPDISLEYEKYFYPGEGKWMVVFSCNSSPSLGLTLQVGTLLCVSVLGQWGPRPVVWIPDPQSYMVHSTVEGLAWDLMLRLWEHAKVFLFTLQILEHSSPSLWPTIYQALGNKHFTCFNLFNPHKISVKILYYHSHFRVKSSELKAVR